MIGSSATSVTFSAAFTLIVAAFAATAPTIGRERTEVDVPNQSSTADTKHTSTAVEPLSFAPSLKVALTPAKSIGSTDGTQSLEVAVEVASTHGGIASVAVAYYLADELGELVGEVEPVPPREVEAGQDLRTITTVAGALPDGVYRLRAIAAGVGDFEGRGMDTEETAQASAFFRIEDGQVIPIEFGEWYRASDEARRAKQLENLVPVSMEPITSEHQRRYAEYLRKQTLEQRGVQ
jgi:hypothetical protein